MSGRPRILGCLLPTIFILVISGCGVYELATLPSKLWGIEPIVEEPECYRLDKDPVPCEDIEPIKKQGD